MYTFLANISLSIRISKAVIRLEQWRSVSQCHLLHLIWESFAFQDQCGIDNNQEVSDEFTLLEVTQPMMRAGRWLLRWDHALNITIAL